MSLGAVDAIGDAHGCTTGAFARAATVHGAVDARFRVRDNFMHSRARSNGACSRARGRIGVARTRGVESYLTRGTVARGIHAFARVIIQRWR